MLKIVERKITLQLLVFYGLFVIPLLLGGAELYFFQYDALQQSAQQADIGLAQALADDVDTYVQGIATETMELARSQAATHLDLVQLSSLFAGSQQMHPEISQYIVCDTTGTVLIDYIPHKTNIAQKPDIAASVRQVRTSGSAYVLTGFIDPVTHAYVVSIATPITNSQHQLHGVMILTLLLQQLNPHLLTLQQELNHNGEVRIWIMDSNGVSIINTRGVAPATNLLQSIPGLRSALHGKTGNIVASDAQRDWLYSYVPVRGTGWTVAVGRPTDVTFATVISFQHSLIIALIMLLVGASVFWFVMHGWVVAPLGKLAEAATMIKPDQAVSVTDNRALAREKRRLDEIGKLVNAFSVMEAEIHQLFRKSDEQSYTRLQTLDALLRSMDEGVLLESPVGEVVYANHRFVQFIGLAASEVLQGTFSGALLAERMKTLVEHPETYHELLQGAEESDGPQIIEFQVRGSYNQLGQFVPSKRVIRMRLFQVCDMTGQVIGRGKIMQDVTQQNEAEQVKKNLLAIVSHELRTPLAAIKGYATSLLETDIELDACTQHDFLQRIVKEGDRMAELVTSLLEMSQLEAGTLKLIPSLCRLDILIRRVLDTLHIGRLQIQLVLPSEVPVVYIDQRRMEMVLRNLLENAQRYAGDDATIEICVCSTEEPEERGIAIRLTDNGPGLPEALIERIFERFYQVDGGRERSSSGVGLGLAICRGFVEAHGGRIWAENRRSGGTGAVFHIWLPARLLHRPGVQFQPFKLEKVFS
jgi:Osmosensitive K+ channel histidine kinase